MLLIRALHFTETSVVQWEGEIEQINAIFTSCTLRGTYWTLCFSSYSLYAPAVFSGCSRAVWRQDSCFWGRWCFKWTSAELNGWGFSGDYTVLTFHLYWARTALNSLLTVSVNTNSLLAVRREYWHKQLDTGSLTSKSVGQTIGSTVEKIRGINNREGRRLEDEGGRRRHVRSKTPVTWTSVQGIKDLLLIPLWLGDFIDSSASDPSGTVHLN